jgi:predicted ester cyclase
MLDEIAEPRTHEAVEAARQVVLRAFPDYRIEVEAIVAEDDFVATVWRARGTHRGDWESPMGTVPATGRAVGWTGTTTLRLADGRIADTVGTNWDHLGILQAMGAVDSVRPRPGA